MADNRRTRRILARIRRIPRGHVQAYSDIDPIAPRLVGRVLHDTNADVPWHRVVRADGSIPKGDRQRELLLAEGVPMKGSRVDMALARDVDPANYLRSTRTAGADPAVLEKPWMNRPR